MTNWQDIDGDTIRAGAAGLPMSANNTVAESIAGVAESSRRRCPLLWQSGLSLRRIAGQVCAGRKLPKVPTGSIAVLRRFNYDAQTELRKNTSSSMRFSSVQSYYDLGIPHACHSARCSIRAYCGHLRLAPAVWPGLRVHGLVLSVRAPILRSENHTVSD